MEQKNETMQTRTMVMVVRVTVPLLRLIMHALEEAQQLQIFESSVKLALSQIIPLMLTNACLSVEMD